MRTTSLLPLLAVTFVAPAETHFHHLHLNSTDPAAAIPFYTSRFDSEALSFAGSQPAVFAQKSWLLFTKVETSPPQEITSAIWHFGWGAEDMKAEYQRQLALGTKFDTPITELFPNFFYSYVAGPDGALIEINTARHHRFGHLHLLSADPIAAGEWYIRRFGARRVGGSNEAVKWGDAPVGPWVSLMMDNVNIILFPTAYARWAWPQLWKDRTTFDSPRGRVVDHIAFSVDDLAAALEGHRVLTPPAPMPGTNIQSAFIEGPDNIAIELVENHTHAAWGSSHASQPVPEFMHGEECLFCHRNTIGLSWRNNAHARTVTLTATEPQEAYTLGGRHHSRLLVRQGLGRFAIFDPSRKLWDARKFEERCAGCHSTAVDPKDRRFAYHGLDCYTCHGDVPLKHASDSSLVLLSKKRRDNPRLIGAICASCHARGGVSQSTGLPYPSNFVPGDNLFLDFLVKFDQVEDAHVARSIRDTALGASAGTCLNCHSIHGASTEKHRRVLSSAICLDCHIEGRPRKQVRRLERRSRTCEY